MDDVADPQLQGPFNQKVNIAAMQEEEVKGAAADCDMRDEAVAEHPLLGKLRRRRNADNGDEIGSLEDKSGSELHPQKQESETERVNRLLKEFKIDRKSTMDKEDYEEQLRLLDKFK